VAPFKRISTLVAPYSSIKIPSFGICLFSCPPENRSMASTGDRGSRLRNPDLETRAANVWDQMNYENSPQQI